MRRADGLATIALLAFAAWSASALSGVLSAEPWMRLAFRMEASSELLDLPPAMQERLARRVGFPEAVSCDHGLSQGLVTVAMDFLRRGVVQNASATEREAATRAGADAVRHALRCSPSDANLWYVLALMEWRATQDWQRTRELLLMSASLAPNEGDIVLKRARLASLALARSGTDLPDALRTDLRKTVALLDVASASAVLADLRRNGREALARDLIADLPERRQAALAAGTDYRRSTFGRPERYRHYDFRLFRDDPT